VSHERDDKVAPGIIRNSLAPAAGNAQPNRIEIAETLVQSNRKMMIANKSQAAPVTRRIHQY
jgi:hypothetical protein